jgi:hypothetical protein
MKDERKSPERKKRDQGQLPGQGAVPPAQAVPPAFEPRRRKRSEAGDIKGG